MNAYPTVIGELLTLRAVAAGFSIARYGDGEFNLAFGRKCVSQVAHPELQIELQSILTAKHKECLVGVPTMDPEGPKYSNWSKYAPRYAELLNPKKVYYSAFITRPDSAPWIDTIEYYDAIENLWAGQRVTLVGNGIRSLKPAMLLQKARQVDFVECSYSNSYRQIDRLYADCLKYGNRRVILCCGPTATCLAYRLSKTKIEGQRMQGIDLGHIGMFWRRYLEAHK